MIAHVMWDSIFAKPFVDLINSRSFGQQQEFFIIVDQSIEQRWFGTYANATEISTNRRRLFAHLDLLRQLKAATRDADRVFFHGMFSPIAQEFLISNPAIRRKSVWIVWGADLYPHVNPASSSRGVRTAIDGMVLRTIVRSAPFSMTLTPGDGGLLQGFAKRHLEILPALYRNPVQPPLRTLGRERPLARQRPLRILIGNSATKASRHGAIISALARFKEHDIQVVAPLGYGDSDYAQAVCAEGVREFGEKFVPLLMLESPDEYARTLESVDIAVFNSDRQQGLGTIFALGHLGKKVYTPKNNSSWEYLGSFFRVYETESLADISFEEFRAMTTAEATEISLGAAKAFDEDFIAEHWQRAFDWRSPQ